MPFNHQNAVTTWETVSIAKDGTLETVLMVETQLPLTPEHGKFEQDRLNALVEAIVGYMQEHNHIDRAELVPLRG
jgi:hypothetical protein